MSKQQQNQLDGAICSPIENCIQLARSRSDPCNMNGLTMRRILLLISLFATIVSNSAKAEDSVILRNLNLVDVAAGTVRGHQDVLVKDGTIVDIGVDIELTDDIRVFQGNGAFMIPGLWDSHVHVFTTPDEPDTALPMYLLNGVTGIRDMGALWPIEKQQRLAKQIERGDVLAPRVVLSGAWVDAPPGSWPGMFLADNPAEAATVVERISSEGWASVKAYSMLDEPTYNALAAAAVTHNLPLVGHIPEQIPLHIAIAVGQAGMEHFGRITQACSTREDDMVEGVREALTSADPRAALISKMATHNAIILETWDKTRCRQLVTSMADAEMHVSPTLVVADFYVGRQPDADSLRMRLLPDSVRKTWRQPDFRLEAMTDELRAIADESIALDRRTFLMAHDAGVPILASTDASFANPFLIHGFSLLDELDRYVEIGLTPQQALYTATVSPPLFLQLEDQDGVIAPGRRADLVLLTENPLTGLATLRNPVAVVVHGQLLDRSTLDSIRDELLTRGE